MLKSNYLEEVGVRKVEGGVVAVDEHVGNVLWVADSTNVAVELSTSSL